MLMRRGTGIRSISEFAMVRGRYGLGVLKQMLPSPTLYSHEAFWTESFPSPC